MVYGSGSSLIVTEKNFFFATKLLNAFGRAYVSISNWWWFALLTITIFNYCKAMTNCFANIAAHVKLKSNKLLRAQGLLVQPNPSVRFFSSDLSAYRWLLIASHFISLSSAVIMNISCISRRCKCKRQNITLSSHHKRDVFQLPLALSARYLVAWGEFMLSVINYVFGGFCGC